MDMILLNDIDFVAFRKFFFILIVICFIYLIVLDFVFDYKKTIRRFKYKFENSVFYLSLKKLFRGFR